MSTPLDEFPYPKPPGGAGRSSFLLWLMLGLVAGVAVSAAFLFWRDQHRRERLEHERVLLEQARAAKAREEANRPIDAGLAATDALGRLNDQFRSIYRTIRAERLAATSPIVVAEGDDLVLVRDGERKRITVVPAIYHQLKSIAHVPLAVYLMTGLDKTKEIPTERHPEITRCREWIKDARRELAETNYPPELRKRQEKMLDECDRFLALSHERAFQHRPIDAKERVEFARRLKPLILANVHDAAKAQIGGMDAQMAKWRKELSEHEWKDLKVVVIGSAMPRKNHIAVQYFSYLFDEPGEGKRIIYAESLFDEQKALSLLGTHVLDSEIGGAFFADPARMSRDLLGDDAEQILGEMRRSRKSGKGK